MDLNNQRGRDENATADTAQMNANSLSRIMRDDLALLNVGTAYRDLPFSLRQGDDETVSGINRRFVSDNTLGI